MFTKGFEKTAGFVNALGALGKFKGGAKVRIEKVVAAVKKPLQEGAAAYTAGRRSVENPARAAAATKLGPAAAAIKAEKVKKRAENIQQIRAAGKPSFAMKHPYLTAGGAFVAGKYVFGDKEKEQPAPPPQVY